MSKVYVEFKPGEYNYDTFNQMVKETGWMGCFPFYAYENGDEKLGIPSDVSFENSLQKNRIDWLNHNKEVIKRLSTTL